MSEDLEKLQRLLEQATAAEDVSADELDPEAASLREAWIGFGQLLEAAQPPTVRQFNCRTNMIRSMLSLWERPNWLPSPFGRGAGGEGRAASPPSASLASVGGRAGGRFAVDRHPDDLGAAGNRPSKESFSGRAADRRNKCPQPDVSTTAA